MKIDHLLLVVVMLSLSCLANAAEFEAFEGTWRLKSHTIEYVDGSSSTGPNTDAYLVYSKPGYVCYMGANPNRPVIQDQSTVEDVTSAFRGFSGYCAEVELNKASSSVTHHVLVARSASDKGRARERYFEFISDDHLRLSVAKKELPSNIASRILEWERLTSPSSN